MSFRPPDDSNRPKFPPHGLANLFGGLTAIAGGDTSYSDFLVRINKIRSDFDGLHEQVWPTPNSSFNGFRQVNGLFRSVLNDGFGDLYDHFRSARNKQPPNRPEPAWIGDGMTALGNVVGGVVTHLLADDYLTAINKLGLPPSLKPKVWPIVNSSLADIGHALPQVINIATGNGFPPNLLHKIPPKLLDSLAGLKIPFSGQSSRPDPIKRVHDGIKEQLPELPKPPKVKKAVPEEVRTPKMR